MSDPGIPTEFRHLLARLELLSHGSTSGWNKSSPPSDPDRSPRGEGFPPHEQFLIDWYCAGDDETAQRRVVREAHETLEQWSRRVEPKKLTPEPVHKRNEEILSKGEGWDAREVARVYRLSIREVVDIRNKAGRDPSTGKKPLQQPEPAAQAREMKARGMTVRQIAAYQDVPKSVVGRWLKDAA